MDYYFNPLSSNCRKPRAVAQHLGIQLQEKVLDVTKGEHKASSFLAINPNGMIPALVDGNLKLWESNAIMLYLAESKANDLWPSDRVQRAEITRWTSWALAHFQPACDTFSFENVLKGMLNLGTPDQARLDVALTNFNRFGAVLHAHLESNKFLVGNTFTLADIAVAAPLTHAKAAKIPLQNYKNITPWLDNLNEIPAWRDTAPKL